MLGEYFSYLVDPLTDLLLPKDRALLLALLATPFPLMARAAISNARMVQSSSTANVVALLDALPMQTASHRLEALPRTVIFLPMVMRASLVRPTPLVPQLALPAATALTWLVTTTGVQLA